MNENALRKIEALLATANHPNTGPAEAEAASAMAEKLMMKHAIDTTMLQGPTGQKDEAVKVVFKFTGQYIPARRSLLNAIARPCGVIVVKDGRTLGAKAVWMVGTTERVELVKKLFATLDLQMANEATRTRPANARNGAEVVSWRTNFQKGFASKVGKRVREQMDNAKREAIDEHGPGVGIMLADEDARVKRLLAESFGRLGHSSSRAGSFGFGAGQEAGGRADIGNRRLAGRMALGAG